MEQTYRSRGAQLKRRAQRILQELAPAEDAVAQALIDKLEHPDRPLEFLVDWAAFAIRRDTLRLRERETLIGLADDVDALLHEEQNAYKPSKAPQGVLRPVTSMDTIAVAELHADFDRAVRALPGPERDAYILTELRGLTVREAADVLDTSKSGVDRLRQAALTHIREEIA